MVIEEDDIIHVILHPKPPAPAPGSVAAGGRIVVDRWKNALVVLPDILVSPTRVTDSLGCQRRGVLGELVNEGGTSRPALMGQVRVVSLKVVWCECVELAHSSKRLTPVPACRGTCGVQLKHALFEQAMLAGNFRGQFLADTALQVVRQPSTMQVRAGARHHTPMPSRADTCRPLLCVRGRRVVYGTGLQSLYAIGAGEDEALGQLRDVIPSLQRWASQFVSSNDRVPGERHTIEIGEGGRLFAQLQVKHTEATEDSVWSPMWGIKGQLDAVVTAKAPVRNGTSEQPPEAYLRAHPKLARRVANAGAAMPRGGRAGGGVLRSVMPLELKTGKRHMSHFAQVSGVCGYTTLPVRASWFRSLTHCHVALTCSPTLRSRASPCGAQVSMYSLLMADRYGDVSQLPMPLPDPRLRKAGLARSQTTPVRGASRDSATSLHEDVAGLLVYMRKDSTEMSGVRAKWDDLRHLLIIRNAIAKGLQRFNQFVAATEGPATATATGGGSGAGAGGHEPRLALPPMLGDRRTCSSCFKFRACTLYHAALEGGTAQSSGLGSLFTNAVSHLSAACIAYVATPPALPLPAMRCGASQPLPSGCTRYFRKWDRLLTAESGGSLAADAAMWTTDARERMQSGRCASDLRLVGVERENSLGQAAAADATAGGGDPKAATGGAAFTAVSGSETRFRYTFELPEAMRAEIPPTLATTASPSQASPGIPRAKSSDSLRELSLGVGDWVVVSQQGGAVAVMRGSVVDVTDTQLVVRAVQPPSRLMSKRVSKPSAVASGAGATGVDIEDMVPARDPLPTSSAGGTVAALAHVVWRVDRAELQTANRQMRMNLVNMLAGPTVQWDDGLDPPDPPTDDAQDGSEAGGGGRGGEAQQARQKAQSAPTFGDVKRKVLVVDLAPPRVVEGPCMPWEPEVVAAVAKSAVHNEAARVAGRRVFVRRENPWLEPGDPQTLARLKAEFATLNSDQVCVVGPSIVSWLVATGR